MKVAINEVLLSKSKIKTVNDATVFKNIDEINSKKTFIFSSIRDCQKLSKNSSGIVRYFNISVSSWLAYIKDEYVNFNGYFKQSCQLNESDIGNFCRSNSGNKVWSGQLIKDENDLKFVKQQTQPDCLLYLASPKEVSQEMRLWYINGKCAGYSKYSTFEKISQNNYIFDIEEYIEYGNHCCKLFEPDDLFTIDICVCDNKLKVMEYNCFSTSGFYDVDVDGLVKEVKSYFDV